MFKDIKQAYSMFLFVYYLQGLFSNVQKMIKRRV
jgi:hypothetical protein